MHIEIKSCFISRWTRDDVSTIAAFSLRPLRNHLHLTLTKIVNYEFDNEVQQEVFWSAFSPILLIYLDMMPSFGHPAHWLKRVSRLYLNILRLLITLYSILVTQSMTYPVHFLVKIKGNKELIFSEFNNKMLRGEDGGEMLPGNCPWTSFM